MSKRADRGSITIHIPMPFIHDSFNLELMKINIQSSTPTLRKDQIQSVTKKIKTFVKDFKTIREVDVKLKQDISTGGITSEIYLKMSDKNIFAIQGGRNFDVATDKSIVKLQNQLNKGVVTPESSTSDPEE